MSDTLLLLLTCCTSNFHSLASSPPSPPAFPFPHLLSCTLGLALTGREHYRRGICSHLALCLRLHCLGTDVLLGSLGRPRISSQERPLWSSSGNKSACFPECSGFLGLVPKVLLKVLTGGQLSNLGNFQGCKPLPLSMGLPTASASIQCTSHKMSEAGKSSF